MTFKFKFINLILLLVLNSYAAASPKASQAETISPYADLTLNVHWDAAHQDMSPADLSAMSKASGAKYYRLAFITDAGTCHPAWGGQEVYSVSSTWGKRMIDEMRKNHINTTVSFGGASGNDISLACTPAELIKAYEQVITTYQPDALDFDIENGTANVAKVMTALKQVQHNHPELPISFTLPVMPEGLTASGKEIVEQAKQLNLNFAVNIMAMDYGPSYNNDMGQYAIEAATNLFSYLKSLFPEKSDKALWQMVEVTPMIGVNDVSIEQFTLNDVDTLMQFALKKGLGHISFWSASRDLPCASKWAENNCSGNNLQTIPYEYTKRFLNAKIERP